MNFEWQIQPWTGERAEKEGQGRGSEEGRGQFLAPFIFSCVSPGTGVPKQNILDRNIRTYLNVYGCCCRLPSWMRHVSVGRQQHHHVHSNGMFQWLLLRTQRPVCRSVRTVCLHTVSLPLRTHVVLNVWLKHIQNLHPKVSANDLNHCVFQLTHDRPIDILEGGIKGKW